MARGNGTSDLRQSGIAHEERLVGGHKYFPYPDIHMDLKGHQNWLGLSGTVLEIIRSMKIHIIK